MAKVTLQDIEVKQLAMVKLAESMVDMTDVDQLLATGKQLELDGAELQALAKRLESETLADVPPQKKNVTVVVLTPAQRVRVKEETGLDMEVVELEDTDGMMARMMPNTLPPYIEIKALEAARRKAKDHYTEQQSRIEMFQLIAEFEASSPEAAELLSKLKDDPTFMGGCTRRSRTRSRRGRCGRTGAAGATRSRGRACRCCRP